ncbi:MAG: hypothetical protein GY719_02635 [bacterium]|nr:hypothetical protein [bacterium]
MPITRDYRDTIRDRLQRDPAFREELLEEGIRCRDVQSGIEALERGEYDEYDLDDIRRLATDIKTRGRQTLAARGGADG